MSRLRESSSQPFRDFLGGSVSEPPYEFVKPKDAYMQNRLRLYVRKWLEGGQCVVDEEGTGGFAFPCDFPVPDHGSPTLLTLKGKTSEPSDSPFSPSSSSPV